MLVASVALVPMVFYGCSPEWARWDATQAHAFFREGETDDALYQLRDAVKKNPRDPVLKTTLAERLIEIDQAEDAIELSNEVLEVYPGNAKAMEIKSKAHKNLGEFETSLEIELEIDKQLHAYRRDVDSLNQLAYARALAGKDLHLAKRDIENAIVKMNRQLRWEGDNGLIAEVRAVVLASMVARSCNAQEDAIPLISSLIDFYREKITSRTASLTDFIYKEADASFPIRNNSAMKKRRQELRLYESQAASLLSCRALLYQDLGKPDLCTGDRVETRHLGYDSEKLLAHVPDDKIALEMIGYASALLDTRGFICSRLPWNDELEGLSKQDHFSDFDSAIRDLNIAVFCSEVRRKAVDTPLRHTIDTFDANEEKEELGHQSAVLLFHRQELLKRQGENDLAKQDEERIRELGYERAHRLH
jgi:tetratricopeptide (TPR) repeat protein